MSKRWDILGDHSSKDKKITSVSSESAIHFLPKCVSDYLRRTNFRIFSLFRIFFVFAFFAHFVCAKILEIFARIYFRAPSDFQISKTWDMAIKTKNRHIFAKILTGIYFCARNWKNSVLIFAQFRANPGSARKCAKISTRENLYE